MAKTKDAFDPHAFLEGAGLTKQSTEYGRDEAIFAQGDASDSVMFIKHGGVKLSVLSKTGREAVVAMLGPGDFFGEGCLAGQPLRIGSATAITPSNVLVIGKAQDGEGAPRAARACLTASSRTCCRATSASSRT